MKNLPLAPSDYDQRYQTELNTILTELDEIAVKLDKDNFVIDGGIVLRSPDGTFYKLEVANGGGLSTSAVTTEQSSNPYV
tara:strand:+ start:538 stop:777 length:240 start_codon:yes stop_codon:yes gene_type:complete